MTDDATPSDEADATDSGPFCRHWGDPSDCDMPCVCGHSCHRHEYDDVGPCLSCDPCTGFRDAHYLSQYGFK